MKNEVVLYITSYISPGIEVILSHFKSALTNKGYKMTISQDIPTKGVIDDCIIIPYGPKDAYTLCRMDIPFAMSFMVDYYSLGCLNWVKTYWKFGLWMDKFFVRKILQMLLNKYRESVVLKHVNNVMFVSQSDIDAMTRRFPKSNYYCLPNGVKRPPYVRFVKPDHDAIRLGILCHWTEDSLKENYWFLKKVFPKLRKKYPQLELVIAGKGASDKIKNYFNSLDGINFIGEFAELKDFFNQIDIYAATTLRGCGIMNKVLDAFAYSKPVIGTAESFSGFSSLKDGYLICKTAEEFSKVLDLYLSGNSVFQTNVKNAYEYIEKYHNWNRNYVEFVDKLFQNKILK